MPVRFPTIMLPLLVLVVAGLGYANVRLANFDVETAPLAPPDAATGAEAATRPTELALAAPPRSTADFPQTTLRPIFFADRRMPEKPKPKPAIVAEVKAPPALPPLELLQLVGIVGSDQNRRALLRSKTDPQGAWLRVGDEYRGWKLQEITSDNAVVEARGQRNELRLYAFGGAKTQSR